MAKPQAFSAFFQRDADINLSIDFISKRIRSEIHSLGLVILVFDIGTTSETRLYVKECISDFVRSITSKKFEIGIVKEMALDGAGNA